MAKKREQLMVVLSLLLIGMYWYSVRPLAARGYVEDWCHVDLLRQALAESLAKTGKPEFYSRQFGAPFGTSLAFMSWGLEETWLGAWVWKLSRDFPFLWAYFGVSLLASYFALGTILRKMRLSAVAAWGLACIVVLLNVPRHFKIWHHYEHLLQHWVYVSIFLDAWIWQRFFRDKRSSLNLEAWRGFLLLGMLGTAGYFWGPLILEWLLVRGCMLTLVRSPVNRQGIAVEFERDDRKLLWPVILGTIWLVLDLLWFLPLKREADLLGPVEQGLAWFVQLPYILRPLWWDGAAAWVTKVFGFSPKLNPFTQPETVVTIGWFFWIPVLLGLRSLRKKRGGPGLAAALPFLLLVVIAALYISVEPPLPQQLLQSVIPFMKFFRVACRWGLFLPAFAGAIIALCWPELTAWFRKLWATWPRRMLPALVVFGVLSVCEISVLLAPVSVMPPLSASATQLLEGVKNAPGSAVLDLPFCHAGGNGVCTDEQCPNYPASTVSACFRLWHDKAVYGIYASRLVDAQCTPYRQEPYTSWFSAWREQRCFDEREWVQFCGYLHAHTELSAVLLYPDIWSGASTPACLDQFKTHLGEPIAEATFAAAAIHGHETPRMSRVFHYAPQCAQ